jgi:Ca2+-binding EF-hand superfamily protein
MISKKEKAQLDYIFLVSDTNKDRKLSKAEIRALAKRQGEKIDQKDLDFGFKILDTNFDGLVSYQEILDAAEKYNKNSPFDLKQYSKVEKTNFLFNRYDTSKNGFLSAAEIKVFLIDIGYTNPSDKDVKWIVSLMDTNFDGKVTWNELYKSI